MAGILTRILRHMFCMLPGVIGAGVLFFLLLGRRKKRLTACGFASGCLRECGMFLFWTFSGGMAVITLCPEPGWLACGLGWGYWTPYFDLGHITYRTNLIPFVQMDGSLYNLVGNIVMFLPFGFFAALLWRGCTWKRAVLMGLGITTCIECWQKLVGRYFDVDDIILNTLGVLCGYLLWRILKEFAPIFTERFHVGEGLAPDPGEMPESRGEVGHGNL